MKEVCRACTQPLPRERLQCPKCHRMMRPGTRLERGGTVEVDVCLDPRTGDGCGYSVPGLNIAARPVLQKVDRWKVAGQVEDGAA